MVKQREENLTSEDLLRVIDNATAYPVMVADASAPGATRSGPADETQRIVDTALRSVLGGRTRVDDPDGLKAALARSFVEDRVDGRRVYRNVPRGSIADTIGEGEVSGFQGALMAHAREVVDHGLPLLAGMKSLVPITDEDDVTALASVVRSEVINLRDEFGRRDGPRLPVVKTALRNLLGKGSTTDPDRIRGAVGRLRDDLGLTAGLYVSNIEDEHQLTNYRLLAEYVVGLRTAWQTASPIFGTGSGPAFVTAQLRNVELTMQTITESIDQVRTAMESVFLGEAERKIQKFDLPSLGARMTIEELLEWAEEVVSPDSVTLIREGGRIAIADSLVPTSSRILAALNDVVKLRFRGGLGASRVKKSLEDLQEQWSGLTDELKRLGSQSVVVPDVRGKSLKNARKALGKVGLKSRVAGRATNSSVVLSSNPGQGKRVQPGRIVELFAKDCSATGIPGRPQPSDPGGPPISTVAPPLRDTRPDDGSQAGPYDRYVHLHERTANLVEDLRKTRSGTRDEIKSLKDRYGQLVVELSDAEAGTFDPKLGRWYDDLLRELKTVYSTWIEEQHDLRNQHGEVVTDVKNAEPWKETDSVERSGPPARNGDPAVDPGSDPKDAQADTLDKPSKPKASRPASRTKSRAVRNETGSTEPHTDEAEKNGGAS